MNGHIAAKGSRRARTVKVAPIAHAVRIALATSATALALVASGSAFAQSCTPVDGSNTTTCSGSFTDTVNNAPTFPMPAPVDLTVVLGDGVVPTSVIPATQGAAGVEAAWAGNASIITSADISTDSGDGIHAAGSDSVLIDNSGSISTTDNLGGAMALDISALGDIDIINSGALDSASEYYDVTTVRADTGVGDVSIDNQGSGSITADSGYGSAIGVYAYSYDGHAGVSNDGTIQAGSGYGLADGIFASGMTTGVANSGSITASGFDWAAGIEAQGYDLTTVTNGGDISATATANDETYGIYGSAFGIYATGGAAGVTATNSGAISVDGVYAHGLFIQAGGASTIANSGDITVGGDPSLVTTYFATGINASNNYENSAIVLDNSGSIAADGYFSAAGIDVAASGVGGTTSVINRGDVSAVSGEPYYGNAAGILVSGDAGADVHNGADGTVYASGSYTAYGVQALTFNGDAHVVNDGSVTASADGDAKYSAYALGVLASSLNGTATVTNTGSISANAASQFAAASRGIYAGGVSADVVNSGLIETYGGTSLGIGAVGSTGDVTVLNQGSIDVNANKYSNGTGIIGSSIYGDVSLTNSSEGTIVALGVFGAEGMRGESFYGNVDVVNAGSIVAGSFDPYGFAQPNVTGIYAGSRTGNVSVVNSGTILAQTENNPTGIEVLNLGDGTISVDNSGGIQAIGYDVNVKGIYALGFGGDIALANSGTIEASTYGYRALGIYTCNGDVDSDTGCGMTGNISVTNDGTITTVSNDAPDGVRASALRGSWAKGIWVQGGNVDVSSAGSISANGFAQAVGIEASGGNQAGVTSNGDISVVATANDTTNQIYGQAFGIKATGGAGGVGVANSGGIDATATFTAIGISAASDGGDSSVINGGAIAATSTYGEANGIFATGDAVTVANGAAGIHAASADGDVTVGNSGAITATATAAYGVANGILANAHGDVTINNAGQVVSVAGNPTGFAAAVQMASLNGASTLNNGGSLSAQGSDGSAWAVFGSDRVEVINNTGDIFGAVSVAGGNDIFNNGDDGVWHLDASRSTDFGDGDDRLLNASGGTLVLADSSITFGAGSNSFINAGTIKVAGDSFIDMTDGSAEALAAALKRPKRNPAFTNNGTIDMLDGAADDSLTITGSFGGNGYLNLDVSLTNQLNDKLFVAGGVLNGSRQYVNIVLLDGLPGSDDVGKTLELAHVSGDTNPSIFQPGQVLGVSPGDFLSLGLELTGTPIDGSIGASYNLTVETLVEGLNAAGVLASSAALGVDSLVTSTTGSWDQRGYAPTDATTPAFATIVPWVRGFRDEGGMSPDHLSGNFGQMSASRLSQDNIGTEMGVELRVANGLRFGTLFAKSEGRQYLVDERGMDTIRGSTLGLYGTWVSPRGFYADASWRTMQFEANLDSAGGRQRTDGHAVTSNVEAGYNWTLGNGLSVQPQLGYTATSVDGLRIQGDTATFESKEANWKRGRAGVSLSKTYGSADGWRWTPRAEFDVVRTFEGIASYSINDDYFGNVMTEGTSALVKFGLGASKGRLSWDGGVNWMDGASFDSALGGQMTLRYSW